MSADPAQPMAPQFDFESFCKQDVIRNSAPAKITLLRGPVYHDETTWSAVLQFRDDLVRFFAELGLRLHINEVDGYAFLDQAPDGEPGSDWPRLLHRDRFSYDVTCVLVILREWLLTQETKTREDRAPLRLDDLLTQLRPFSRKKDANIEREEKRWREAINKVVTLGFLKRWRGEDTFSVRPIIRARLSVDHLKGLRESLEKHSAGGTTTGGDES